MSTQTKTATKKRTWSSRAVIRSIEPLCNEFCRHCGKLIGWQPKRPAHQVICNVYWRGKWRRTEHYHEMCYEQAGRPYPVRDNQQS